MSPVRLFLALWPDAAMQAALADAAASLVREVCAASEGVRPVPTQNLHLTLAFLGSVPHVRVDAVKQVASRCAETVAWRPAPVELVFDTVEHWSKPQILCAVARDASLPAVRLAQALTGALTAERFSPDLTKPFRPHVTLARKAANPSRETTLAPVSWSFREFALVQSRTAPGGSLYTVLNSYRFA
jgi:RNA 2',3'-cyclic 3'-phosphodiesterase